MITINLTPRQLQILNSAMSVYYSTRHPNDPHKIEVQEFKTALLDITAEQVIKPFIEYSCNDCINKGKQHKIL